MRIAMFGHKQIPSRQGGVEVVVEALSCRMQQLGHQVTCFNRSGSPACHQGVRILPVPTWRKRGLAAVTASFFAGLKAALGPFDVVHIHAEGPAFICWLPKLFGKRVVVTVHGLDWQRAKWRSGLGSRFIRWGEKMAVRYADAIIVLSRNMADYFLRAYGRETVWIPNGLCRPHIRPPQIITRQFGLLSGSYILFLGRLVPEKGIHHLIGAFRTVSTDKRLVIAGCPCDTEDYYRELLALAAGDPRILFTGFVEGQLLEELYSNAYLYVLPSEVEGMPIGLLEAMSYGCCCLVSDIPECTEVTAGHAATFLCGNREDLGHWLQRLCDDPDLAAGFRRNVRAYACSHFNWDTTVKKTLELYR